MPPVLYISLKTRMARRAEDDGKKKGEGRLVVNVHDKGEKRGVSIYFCSKEIESLKEMGVDLREVRKFIIAVRKNKLYLTPLSSFYEAELMDIDVLLEITSRFDDLRSLDKEAREELGEAFLSIIVESEVKLSEVEKNAFIRLMKGAWVGDVLKKVLSACTRADAKATQLAINRLVIKNSVPEQDKK